MNWMSHTNKYSIDGSHNDPLKYLFNNEDPDYSGSVSRDVLFVGHTLQKIKEEPISPLESPPSQFSSFFNSPLSSFEINAVNTDPEMPRPLIFNEGAVSVSTSESTGKSQSRPLNDCLTGTDQTHREQAEIESLPTIESRTRDISQNNRLPVADTELSPSNIDESNKKKAGKSRKHKGPRLTGVSKQRRMANKRERDRVHVLRVEMNVLKEMLCENYFPTAIVASKITRFETLVGAINYINHLNELLADSQEQSWINPM
ncbi:helix-loop-helix domain-containing protein [Endozoicomonas sp. YOMI1]|uniref:helix-loop-helix domain-containing protein n=1 Tax=Endozoicomonas sp. YOMI1 TaxID=2828739 RepID=UPI0021486663|nr:helix-loop-helix domain-containing protein [Endozoicomonas sp. YOMI1]